MEKGSSDKNCLIVRCCQEMFTSYCYLFGSSDVGLKLFSAVYLLPGTIDSIMCFRENFMNNFTIHTILICTYAHGLAGPFTDSQTMARMPIKNHFHCKQLAAPLEKATQRTNNNEKNRHQVTRCARFFALNKQHRTIEPNKYEWHESRAPFTK